MFAWCIQVKSIYSGYFASERGLLVFDQLPWFTVAERLEKEKEMMIEEREKFKELLMEQQVGSSVTCLATIQM